MPLEFIKDQPVDEKGIKHGYTFEKEMSDSLAKLSRIWFQKWSDTHMYQSWHKKIVLPQSPADFISIIQRDMGDGYDIPIPIFIECKSTRNRASYDFTLIPDHQVETGLKLAKLNVPYYFVINRRVTGKQLAFVLRPYVVDAIKKKLLQLGKRSMKWEPLHMFSEVILRKADATTWDISFIENPQFHVHHESVDLSLLDTMDLESPTKEYMEAIHAQLGELVRKRRKALKRTDSAKPEDTT
jgi:hypothetical protein